MFSSTCDDADVPRSFLGDVYWDLEMDGRPVSIRLKPHMLTRPQVLIDGDAIEATIDPPWESHPGWPTVDYSFEVGEHRVRIRQRPSFMISGLLQSHERRYALEIDGHQVAED